MSSSNPLLAQENVEDTVAALIKNVLTTLDPTNRVWTAAEKMEVSSGIVDLYVNAIGNPLGRYLNITPPVKRKNKSDNSQI